MSDHDSYSDSYVMSLALITYSKRGALLIMRLQQLISTVDRPQILHFAVSLPDWRQVIDWENK